MGTSGVRAAVVRPDATVTCVHHRAVLPDTPAPGLVEVDAALVARAALELAEAALAEGGPVSGVGIANQRATTVVWDRATGRPVAPAIGWQDLRTVGTCLVLQAEGIRLAPNMSATKLAAILDAVDPDRSAADGLCFGTVDSWVAWTLAGGAAAGLHVTDATNAGVTGLVRPDTMGWDGADPRAAGRPRRHAAGDRRLDGRGGPGPGPRPAPRPSAGSPGTSRPAWSARGAPVPGWPRPPSAPAACSTCAPAASPPVTARRLPAGTFPIVTWQREGKPVWGVEAVMLSAGTCVEWLRDDLGVIEAAEESATVASGCETPATSGSSPPCSGWAPRSGTSGPGARCSG